jgi:hypothetical protein
MEMPDGIEIIGVYPVHGTKEPVYLVELLIREVTDFDFGSVTQAIPGEPRSEWQVAYDERLLTSPETGGTRAVFFFHYLDLAKPLETNLGSLVLPSPKDMPADLRSIGYEPP